MNIIQINNYMIKYEFLEEMDRVSYNTSVYLIYRDNKGLLIDSGYKKYAEKIIEDLKIRNISIEYIINSHYHRDHAEGSVLFDDAKIIASRSYRKNMENCQKMIEGYQYQIPHIIVDEYYKINFEGIKVEIYSTPGHTPCSISTLINNEYLHVSDLILEDIHSKIIIPYIDLNSNPINHLNSLNKIKKLEFKKYLLTHGQLLERTEDVLMPRIHYLDSFIKSNFKAPLVDCLTGNQTDYTMKDIHKLNIRNSKRIKI